MASFDEYYLACAAEVGPDEHGKVKPWTLDRAYEILAGLGLAELAARAWHFALRSRTGSYQGDGGLFPVPHLAKWFGYVARNWPAPAPAG